VGQTSPQVSLRVLGVEAYRSAEVRDRLLVTLQIVVRQPAVVERFVVVGDLLEEPVQVVDGSLVLFAIEIGQRATSVRVRVRVALDDFRELTDILIPIVFLVSGAFDVGIARAKAAAGFWV